MTNLRTGGWSAAQRKKLSAIRSPHKADPKDFYYDAATAWPKLDAMHMEGLGGCGHEANSWGELPARLKTRDEKAREKALGQWVGISWSSSSGRNFSNEYWNPLMGLWVDKEGFDFVFDLTFPNPDEPTTWPFYADDGGSFWAAVRRYLYKVGEDAYAAAQRRVEPIMDRLFAGGDYKADETRDLMALAFTRGTDWAEKLIRGYVDGKMKPGDMSILIPGCTDADLALAAIKKYGGLSGPNAAYYVFDLVESMGGDAVRVLDAMTPRMAPEKKRIAAARKIAEKLA